MPSSYVSLPIETEPDELAQEAFDYMESVVPGWTPSDGQLDVWLISALARQAAELRDVAADVPPSIFRYFGANLMAIPPQDAIPASVTVTITVKNNAGYTIPAGYAAGVRDASGILHAFATTVDVVIPTGSLATTVGAVTLIATVPGADASGIGVNGQAMELITALDAVTAVTMTAMTSGGLDAEEDDAYLDRLARDLALQAPRPILPSDFANFALNTPGVTRALGLDGWDAVLGTGGHARTVSVALADPSGNPVSSAIKASVLSLLQGLREVNFLVYVIDPTYTTIDIQFTATAFTGWDTTAVNAAIVSALQAYLSPANWGQPPTETSPSWSQRTVVKQLDLSAVVGSVQGVKDINTLTFRTGAGAYGTADVNLAGAAPLTLPGSITGTVS